MIVRSVKLAELFGLELICRATRHAPASVFTLVCTRCHERKRSLVWYAAARTEKPGKKRLTMGTGLRSGEHLYRNTGK
jgi:hypothetical protein